MRLERPVCVRWEAHSRHQCSGLGFPAKQKVLCLNVASELRFSEPPFGRLRCSSRPCWPLGLWQRPLGGKGSAEQRSWWAGGLGPGPRWLGSAEEQPSERGPVGRGGDTKGRTASINIQVAQRRTRHSCSRGVLLWSPQTVVGGPTGLVPQFP